MPVGPLLSPLCVNLGESGFRLLASLVAFPKSKPEQAHPSPPLQPRRWEIHPREGKGLTRAPWLLAWALCS